MMRRQMSARLRPIPGRDRTTPWRRARTRWGPGRVFVVFVVFGSGGNPGRGSSPRGGPGRLPECGREPHQDDPDHDVQCAGEQGVGQRRQEREQRQDDGLSPGRDGVAGAGPAAADADEHRAGDHGRQGQPGRRPRGVEDQVRSHLRRRGKYCTTTASTTSAFARCWCRCPRWFPADDHFGLQ